jgi:hypothetical protein
VAARSQADTGFSDRPASDQDRHAATNSAFAFPSADGRWLGYTDAAFTEAWVEPLPSDGRRFQVASGNLEDPQWLSPHESGVSMTDGAGPGSRE